MALARLSAVKGAIDADVQDQHFHTAESHRKHYITYWLVPHDICNMKQEPITNAPGPLL